MRLPRNLSLLAVWGLSFGYAVGWGAFVMPGAKFLPDAGPLGTIIGVVAGAVAMAVIGWNYYRMVVSSPGPGGAYTYASNAFGYDYGFLTAWSLSLAYMAILWANATALVLLVRYVFGDAFQFGWHDTVSGFDVYLGEVLLSMGVMVVAGLCCLQHRRFSGRIQATCALFIVLSTAVCFGVAAFRHQGGVAGMAPAFSPGGTEEIVQVLRILAMMPWAFVGFEAVTHSSLEFKFPIRRLWPILLFAIIASAAVYIMLALLPVLAHPDSYATWSEYIRNFSNLHGLDTMPTFAAVQKTMGGFGVGLLAATMVAAIHTGIVGTIVAMSRLLYTLSSDGVLPRCRWLGKLDDKGSPRNAIMFVVGISLFIPFFGRTVIGWPVEVSSIGAAVAFCCTSAAAWKFARRRGDMLTKVTGCIGVVMSVIFCLLLLVPNYLSTSVLSAESYLVLALWCILGFLLYRQVFKRDVHQRFGRSPVVWTGIVIMIFFSSLMWVRLSSQATTERTVSAIVSFSADHCRRMHGMANPEELQHEEEFVSGRMDDLNREQLVNDIVQMGLLSFSLVIMFSLYSIQRRREERLEVAHTKAEARDRAKSAFLSSISHDIRTPMNAIIGYIELAKRNEDSVEKLREYLAKTDAASQHMLALLNDVLEMSRIESGKVELEPTPIDFNVVFKEIGAVFSTQMAEKGLDFMMDLSQVRHPRVMCDRVRLNRMLLNLISNAYKFTPKGGSVTMTLAEFACGREDAADYELRVKDSGMGMSAEFVKHVFDAFERERSASVSGIDGTGLGMPITKGIVDLMKGTISVESEPDKGTEFIIRLTLPFAPDASIADSYASEDEKDLEPLDHSKMRILVVEDNEINREIATTLLVQSGFLVESAANGKIAVEKFVRGGDGHYDAILMDVQMPVMNGYEATRTIRAVEGAGGRRVPIIALSANAFESDIKDALKAGMDAHIAKPIKLPNLMKTIDGLLRRSVEAPKAELDGDVLRALARMGCDVETTLRETYIGNEKFYLKMLAKLPQNKAIGQMREALEASNAAELFSASHNLKGLYASLGLTPLHAVCSEIVEIARNGSIVGVAELLVKLEKMHADVIALAGAQE
jgi:signal transduction histidine kinase/CheY-like chemotaxis protein